MVIILSIAACSNEPADQRESDVTESKRPDIIATNAFYYYNDVDAAWRFYQDTLDSKRWSTTALRKS